MPKTKHQSPLGASGSSEIHPSPLNQKKKRALAQSEALKIEGKYERALEIAERILIDDPFCAEAAEEVADNMLSLERMEAAEKAARHALRLSPKSYIAHFVLGFLLSQKQQWHSAAKHLQISNNAQSGNPEILRCLGWAIFHDHKPEEGIATLRRALTLRPEDPSILCDIGACLLQKNRFEEAILHLKKALQINTEDDRVRELLSMAHRVKIAFDNHLT